MVIRLAVSKADRSVLSQERSTADRGDTARGRANEDLHPTGGTVALDLVARYADGEVVTTVLVEISGGQGVTKAGVLRYCARDVRAVLIPDLVVNIAEPC